MGGLFASGSADAACTGVAGTSAANNIDASCSCKRSDSRRSASDELCVATGVCDAFGAAGAGGLLSEGRAVDVRPLPNPSVSPGAFGKAALGTGATRGWCGTGLGKIVTGLGSVARAKFNAGLVSPCSALVVIVAAGADGGGTGTAFGS